MDRNLNLSLTESEALEVLSALHEKYMNIKLYFSQCKSEEETTGLPTPKEIKNIYNNLLNQIKKDGSMLSVLELIK
jgi:hypothetical protein